jgi:ribonucleotide monophosphatase NagD (HAD superfamily)
VCSLAATLQSQRIFVMTYTTKQPQPTPPTGQFSIYIQSYNLAVLLVVGKPSDNTHSKMMSSLEL